MSKLCAIYLIVALLTFSITMTIPTNVLLSVSNNEKNYPEMTKLFTTRYGTILEPNSFIGRYNVVLICFLLSFTPYTNILVLICMLFLASPKRCEALVSYIQKLS